MHKITDKILRHLRSRQALKAAKDFLPTAQHICDIGCDDNYFLRQLLKLSPKLNLLGIDPAATHHHPSIKNIVGRFPEDLPSSETQHQYDLIFAIAVFEHFPEERLTDAINTLTAMIAPQGRIILTVPQPAVDYIVNLLTLLHLIDDKAQAEHHHFDPARLPKLMANHFVLEKQQKFEWGLNNLLVFRPKLNDE